MKNILASIQSLEVHELENLEKIIASLIVLKKEMESAAEGRTVKLHQGKRQPILMTDDDGNVIKEFSGFTKCANYIRSELGEKNEQNKLRKALAGESKICGYNFILHNK